MGINENSIGFRNVEGEGSTGILDDLKTEAPKAAPPTQEAAPAAVPPVAVVEAPPSAELPAPAALVAEAPAVSTPPTANEAAPPVAPPPEATVPAVAPQGEPTTTGLEGKAAEDLVPVAERIVAGAQAEGIAKGIPAVPKVVHRPSLPETNQEIKSMAAELAASYAATSDEFAAQLGTAGEASVGDTSEAAKALQETRQLSDEELEERGKSRFGAFREASPSEAIPAEAGKDLDEIRQLSNEELEERGKSRFGARPKEASTAGPDQDAATSEASPSAATEIVENAESREQQGAGEAGAIRYNPDGSVEMVMGTNMDSARMTQLAEAFAAATGRAQSVVGQPTGEYRPALGAAEGARQPVRAERSIQAPTTETVRFPARDTRGAFSKIQSLYRRLRGIRPERAAVMSRDIQALEPRYKKGDREYNLALKTATQDMTSLQKFANDLLKSMPEIQQEIEQITGKIDNIDTAIKALSGVREEMTEYSGAIKGVRAALKDKLETTQEEAKKTEDNMRTVLKNILGLAKRYRELDTKKVQKLTSRLAGAVDGTISPSDILEDDEEEAEIPTLEHDSEEEVPDEAPEVVSAAPKRSTESSTEEDGWVYSKPATLTIPLEVPASRSGQAETWDDIFQTLNEPSAPEKSQPAGKGTETIPTASSAR